MDESRKAEKATTALYSRKPAANKGHKGHKGRKGSNKEVVKCSHCKKQGHIEPECWEKHPEKRPSRGKNQRKDKDAKDDEDDKPALSVVALSTRSGLDRHS